MKLNYKYFYRFFLFSFYTISFLLFCFTNKSFSVNLQTDTCNFSITVSLEKNEYLQGENIYLNLKIKNLSSNKDSLPYAGELSMTERIKIKGKNHSRFYYHGVIVDYFNIPYTYFLPNEEKTYEIELQWCYGDTIAEKITDYAAYFSADNYELYIEYLNEVDTKMPQIKSNTVYFNVSKPTGIELEAFNELIKIYQIQPSNQQVPRLKEKIDAYVNFIDKYPKCVYTERAFSHSLSARKDGRYKFDETLISQALLFMENFPNSRMVYPLLFNISGIMKAKNNDEEIKKFLLDIKSKYPNTRIDESVDRVINEFKDIPQYK